MSYHTGTAIAILAPPLFIATSKFYTFIDLNSISYTFSYFELMQALELSQTQSWDWVGQGKKDQTQSSLNMLISTISSSCSSTNNNSEHEFNIVKLIELESKPEFNLS